MPRFAEKYTDAQREALASTVVDRGISAAETVRLAARGELLHRGERLEPFDADAGYTRNLATGLRRRRAGYVVSELAKKPHRDAIETLRVRLVNAADLLLLEWERAARKSPGKADPERLRQITRCVREAAALPGPKDPRPAVPGHGAPENRTGGDTSGGLAGSIMAAAGMGGRKHGNGDGSTAAD